MSDELNKKVINLFSTHKKDKVKPCQSGSVCRTTEGYFYITIETDESGRHFDEEALLTRANEFYYIVKVLVNDGMRPKINNYKISGDKLLEFIKIYIDGEGEGQVIEIDKFIPEEWA